MRSLLAIAEPTRRRIVELLAERERTAGELVREFNLSAPAISQHLNVLREAGLITTRAEAQARIQVFNPDGLNDLKAWLTTRSIGSRRLHAPQSEPRGGRGAGESRRKTASDQATNITENSSASAKCGSSAPFPATVPGPRRESSKRRGEIKCAADRLFPPRQAV